MKIACNLFYHVFEIEQGSLHAALLATPGQHLCIGKTCYNRGERIDMFFEDGDIRDTIEIAAALQICTNLLCGADQAVGTGKQLGWGQSKMGSHTSDYHFSLLGYLHNKDEAIDFKLA